MAGVIPRYDIRLLLNMIITAIVCRFKKIIKSPHKSKKVDSRYALTQKDIETNLCPLYFVTTNALKIGAVDGSHKVKFSTVVIPQSHLFLSPEQPMQSKRELNVNQKPSICSQRYNNEHMAKDFIKLSKQEYCDQCMESNAEGVSIQTAPPTKKELEQEGLSNECDQRRSPITEKTFCKKCHVRISPPRAYTYLKDRSLTDITLKRDDISSDSFGNPFISRQTLCLALCNTCFQQISSEMADVECRRATFAVNRGHWVNNMQYNTLWNKDAFIDAGFYLTQGGHLTCYLCHMCIRHDIEDEPFQFHHDMSPSCTEILQAIRSNDAPCADQHVIRARHFVPPADDKMNRCYGNKVKKFRTLFP